MAINDMAYEWRIDDELPFFTNNQLTEDLKIVETESHSSSDNVVTITDLEDNCVDHNESISSVGCNHEYVSNPNDKLWNNSFADNHKISEPSVRSSKCRYVDSHSTNRPSKKTMSTKSSKLKELVNEANELKGKISKNEMELNSLQGQIEMLKELIAIVFQKKNKIFQFQVSFQIRRFIIHNN